MIQPISSRKRKNSCSVCQTIGHNKRNCPRKPRGNEITVSRIAKPREIHLSPTLEEIGEIEEEIVETHSVGTIGDGIEGEDSSDGGETEQWTWEDCVVPDAVLGPNNEEMQEIPLFTAGSYGGNLAELGDINALNLKEMFYKF